MLRPFVVVSVLCLLISTAHGIDSIDDDYDCNVAPPLSVEPFTCCKVSKPFDRTNFPECFAPSPNVFSSSSTLPPIPVSEDFHDNYTPSPTRGSIFKKKFKPSPYRTSTNRPTWPPSWHRDDNDDDAGADTGDDTHSDGDGDDYTKKDKYPYYHHHHHGGSSSGGFGHWPGKYQHWGHDNDNQRQFYGGYHHPFGRHRRNAPIFNNNNDERTSNLCAIECVFNQTNIITDGRFSRDNALDVYADYYPEIPIDLLTRTVDRCTRQLRNYLIARRRRSRNQIQQRNVQSVTKRCRNGSGLFAACFNREIYRNCPSEIDTISDDCTSLRNFVDNCSPIRAARLNFSYDSVDVDENGNFIPQNN